MTTEPLNTPLVWDDYCGGILDAVGDNVVDVSTSEPGAVSQMIDRVNAHDDLVAACESVARNVTSNDIQIAKKDGCCLVLLTHNEALAVRAALAKAGKETT